MLYALIIWVVGVFISYPVLKHQVLGEKWTLKDRVQCMQWSLLSFMIILATLCVIYDKWYRKNKDNEVKW